MASRIREKRRQRDRDAFIRQLLKLPIRASDSRNADASSIALARRQLNAGNPVACEETCRQILTRHKYNANAMQLMGTACQLTGAHRQAVDLLRRAVALAPRHAEYHASLGLVLAQQGQMAEAVTAFGKALALQPDDIEVLYNLGLAHVQLREFDQAVAVYEKAIRINPDIAVLHLNCGGAHQMAGRLDAAETCYRRALELDPGSLDTRYNLGTVLGRLSRFDESLETLEQVVAQAPQHLGALRGIGDTRLKIGDNAGAVPHLRHIVELAPDDLSARFSLGHALALSGQTADAVAVCEQAVALAPPAPDNLITLAVAYLCDGRPDAALEICNTVLAEIPGHTSALAFKSTALNELKQFDEARYLLDFDTLVQCIDLAPPRGFDDIHAFNDALCRHVRQHPTLHDSATNRSLNNGLATLELLDDRHGPFAAFGRMIDDAVARYSAMLGVDPDHPFVRGMPRDLSLEAWANIMDSDGFHDTHFHPPGWLSGTYYPALPPERDLQGDDGAGYIEFGRSLYSLPTTVEPATRTVQPREGMVVLFPSYFGHRTIPFKSEEKRISIAFDAVPAT